MQIDTFRNAERLAHLLYRKNWFLVRPMPDLAFVSCDTPMVVAERTGPPGTFRLGAGVASATFEGVMAIDPTLALYLSADDTSDYLNHPGFVWSVWARTIANARRWVFAQQSDSRISIELAGQRRPMYYLEFDNEHYTMEDSPSAIAQRLDARGIEKIDFRYGVPRSRRGRLES